jgi:hypothetical protein
MVIVEKTERRIVSDRRKQPARFISKYTFINGQRKAVRRKADKKKHIYVDWYNPQLLIVLLFLLILSLLDAYFTLTLIKEHGIVEANPVMAFYLDFGNMVFIMEKLLFTAISIFIFCIYSNLSITKVLLTSFIVIYSAVVLYQLNIMYIFFPSH